jgi:hypothetical protein
MNRLRHTLTEAAKEVLGYDVTFPSLYSAKLKDGTQVYRITDVTRSLRPRRKCSATM